MEILWVWRALFIENANKLLAWAGIEGRTVKQLIEMKGRLLRLRLHRLSPRGLWGSDFAICRYPIECFESYPTAGEFFEAHVSEGKFLLHRLCTINSLFRRDR